MGVWACGVCVFFFGFFPVSALGASCDSDGWIRGWVSGGGGGFWVQRRGRDFGGDAPQPLRVRERVV